MLTDQTRVHIIGIAGAGMSPIAHLLLDQGVPVSGCDRSEGPALEALRERGAQIAVGHNAAHVAGCDVLLISSAVKPEHEELQAAQARGIPVLTRHDLWRTWSAQRPALAVAGSHGKTTSTAMLATIFRGTGAESGYLIGSTLPDLGSASWGSGPLIIEADEYARTFLALTPAVAIITNIDRDHVDIYPTDAEYDAAFRQFATTTLDGGGALVASGDDPGVARALAGLPFESFGLGEGNRWRATGIQHSERTLSFTVLRDGAPVAQVLLNLPGEHNVRNALGAIATAAARGIDPQAAGAALAGLHTVGRRLQIKGEAAGVLVYDDYAHHPSEVRATLSALRSRHPARRLVAYFQPHTFTRLQTFLQEFGAALSLADVVRVGEVYGARESGSISLDALLSQIDGPDIAQAGGINDATYELIGLLRPDDVLVTMNAGDGYLVGEHVLEQLQKTGQN